MFKYERLDRQVGSIRVVTVQPSTDREADIECTISHDAVGSAKYIALSYTWGDPDDKQRISLNGKDLEVTKNLHVALRYLRRPTEPIALWIDAICINQSDDDERTHQVKQMLDIYKRAAQVYIWMGEGIENMDAAISLMTRAKYYMSPDGMGLEGLVDLAQSRWRSDAWKAVAELLQRPWWSRAWIIQEVAYGNDPLVICGHDRFSWELLDFMGTWRRVINQITWTLLRKDMDFYCGDFVHASGRLEFLVEIRADLPVARDRLETVLGGVRRSEATDPRDKVFAVLGLLNDDVKLCEVDYRKSVRQVYIEAAAGILKQTNSLRFLSWTHNITERRGYHGRPDGLPSWTPSWTMSENDILQLQSSGEPQAGKSLYSATQDSRHAASCIGGRGTLQVLGFPIDVLKDVSPVCDSRSAVFDGPASLWVNSVLYETFQSLIEEMTGGKPDPECKEMYIQLLPIFWRLILADQWQGARLGQTPIELPRVGQIPPRSFDEIFKLRAAVSSYEYQCAFRWRTLFVSRQSVGLAPPVARPGDIVFAILGCEVPYLIRKCDGGYRFLGEW